MRKKCNLSELTIRKIVNGKTKRIYLDTLDALAYGLDMSTRELLEAVGRINVVNKKVLNSQMSSEFIDAMQPYLQKCRINLNLTDSQKLDVANEIIHFIDILIKQY